MEGEKEKIIEKRFKERLEGILDSQFPKSQCKKERSHALILFSYAVIYLREALEELQKERIMAIEVKTSKEWRKGASTTLKNIREELAALEHEQWMTWTKYVVGHYHIPQDLEENWRKNWKPYSDLTQEEKDKDREWADKVIKLFVNSL